MVTSAFHGQRVVPQNLCIIGVGRTGSEVIRRLQAFGMTIIAYDPYISVEAAERLGIKLVERENLLQEADYISIHVPLRNKHKNTRDLLLADRKTKRPAPGQCRAAHLVCGVGQ